MREILRCRSKEIANFLARRYLSLAIIQSFTGAAIKPDPAWKSIYLSVWARCQLIQAKNPTIKYVQDPLLSDDVIIASGFLCAGQIGDSKCRFKRIRP